MTIPNSVALENLNNAIANIDRHTYHNLKMPKGSRDAIHAMTLHWGDFWNSKTRWLAPDFHLAPKAERYVKWYARAWALCPPDVQAKIVRPDQIDVAWATLARNSLANWNEGAEDTLKKGGDLAVYVAKGAADLAKVAATGLKDTLIVLAFGLGGLYIWMNRRK